jgi:SagB-type dehydrogenase family enzyme
LYPIETYLITGALEGHGASVFHYEPTVHALERLLELPHDFDMKTLAKRPDSLRVSSLIVFTSVWARSSAKYGDLTYAHALLEAGHMSENILLVSTALGLRTRPMAGFDDALVTNILDLDEDCEQAVHSITISGHASDHVEQEHFDD